MYAAAGGASIASRRKQKRLQLNKRSDAASASAAAAARIRNAPASSRKFSRPHVVPQPPPPPPPPSSSTLSAPPPSSNFHSSVDRRRRIEQRCQQLAPVSPIQFPISPPPLSLESPSPRQNKTSNFPFPPPSILDLRVSPSATELQCGGQAPNKAAWQGCNRPPHPLSPASPQSSREGYKTKQCEAHRRWMKRNRIRDASYCYGSSGEDDEEEGSSSAVRRSGEVSAAANTMLYAGLGTTALGLVISFVGTGEKGFSSPELRLIGPSLLCAGLLCCFLRVLLCLCLCRCGHCRWQPCPCVAKKNGKKHKEDVSSPEPSLPTASLLSPLSQPAMPSSCLISPVTRGRELLLSPAQLPE